MLNLPLSNMILLVSANGYLQLVGALIIFLVVLIITAFVTRYVGGVQKSLGQGKNIKVIDTSKIAPNKFLQIVKVGNRFFCIGITQEHITLISEIDEDSLLFKEESQSTSFADLLNVFVEKKTNDVSKSADSSINESIEKLEEDSDKVSLEVKDKDE